MRDLPNIEKHPTARGVYVGYGDGPWHITRLPKRQWRAIKRDGGGHQVFTSLAECSRWLAARRNPVALALTVRLGREPTRAELRDAALVALTEGAGLMAAARAILD